MTAFEIATHKPPGPESEDSACDGGEGFVGDDDLEPAAGARLPRRMARRPWGVASGLWRFVRSSDGRPGRT